MLGQASPTNAPSMTGRRMRRKQFIQLPHLIGRGNVYRLSPTLGAVRRKQGLTIRPSWIASVMIWASRACRARCRKP